MGPLPSRPGQHPASIRCLRCRRAVRLLIARLRGNAPSPPAGGDRTAASGPEESAAPLFARRNHCD